MSCGTTLGGYVLGKLLGRGGMGLVYAAHQPSLGRAVAVKLLHPELAADPRILDRFRTEAVAGARLSHPNTARVIEFGKSIEGTPFLVMEHVPGERLASVLARHGTLPADRACAIVYQILEALDAAHAAGVVHADVKSDNVLVELAPDGEERATLIDFGIARLDDQAPSNVDGEWILSGTPEYIAPEVIGGACPSPASDVYGVGVVLYELLTGSTPFHGGSAVAIFQRHLEDDVVPPSLRCPDARIPPALDRVVLRALAKDPAARGTIEDLAAALIAVMAAGEPRGVSCGTRSRLRTEAPTLEWAVAPHRRFAAGTRPQPIGNGDTLLQHGKSRAA